MRALLDLYWRCAKDASVALWRNALIIPGSIALYIAFMFVARLVQPLGIAGGFILGLTAIALLTLYYSWLLRANQKQRLRLNQLLDFDQELFFGIINVGFILFIATLLIGFLRTNPELQWVYLCVQLGIAIIFNAIPEVLYLERGTGIPALAESSRFVREYWIEWFIPFIVLVSPLLVVQPTDVLFLLAGTEPFLPPGVIVQALRSALPQLELLGLLAALVIATWFMMFRSFLFERLQAGYLRRAR